MANHSKEWHKHNEKARELELKADKAQDKGDNHTASALRSSAKEIRRSNPH